MIVIIRFCSLFCAFDHHVKLKCTKTTKILNIPSLSIYNQTSLVHKDTVKTLCTRIQIQVKGGGIFIIISICTALMKLLCLDVRCLYTVSQQNNN